jgi:hypothetical protein
MIGDALLVLALGALVVVWRAGRPRAAGRRRMIRFD